jgi:hypothetical protein
MRLPRALMRQPRLLMRTQVVVHTVRGGCGLMCVGSAKMNLSSVDVFGCRHRMFLSRVRCGKTVVSGEW